MMASPAAARMNILRISSPLFVSSQNAVRAKRVHRLSSRSGAYGSSSAAPRRITMALLYERPTQERAVHAELMSATSSSYAKSDFSERAGEQWPGVSMLPHQ